MPATHPFAIKLENAIVHARRVRDALLAAKTATKEEEKKAEPEKKPHPYRFVQLGALAASGMERQADVQAGEANASFDKTISRPGEDKVLKGLMLALARQEGLCAQLRALRNRDAGREVQTPCPGVTAAREALMAYTDRLTIGPQSSNSGGGGGGGF